MEYVQAGGTRRRDVPLCSVTEKKGVYRHVQ